MLLYLAKRIAGALPVIFIGITLTFFLVHAAPGDPLDRFTNPSMPSEARDAVAHRFGLDQPVYVQYALWLKRVVLSFDFGDSFTRGRGASDVILDALPATVVLTGLSLLLGMALGIGAGVISAARRGGWQDRMMTSLLLFFYSMPAFWLGIILLGIFSLKLGWLPASQLTGVNHDAMSLAGRIADYASHLFLPVSTLALASAAVFGRYVRADMIEAMNSDYALAARARGISERKVLLTYCLRNAMTPLITLAGLSVPVLFSGAVVIEWVFALPGMGRVMVEAVLGRDYPVILASATVAFIAVIIGNLLADVGYALADPRVRLRGGAER